MDRVLRTLTIKSFHVDQVTFSDKTFFDAGVLTINRGFEKHMKELDKRIENVRIDIIQPGDFDRWTNSIMDVIPISTKVLGNLGEGITHTLTGAYVVLTGCDVDGKQMAEFGSSEGTLKEQMVFGRAGTPSEQDRLILVDIVLKQGTSFERSTPAMMHRICDTFIQTIRQILKECDGRQADYQKTFEDRIREGKKKVVIIKQVGGQGAMHDNHLLPSEPSGYKGGKSNIDLGNVPVILSPNEYRDGALRAMT